VNVSAVDLFCGAGGLTYGLENAGIDVEKGIDVDPDCRYPYDENNDASFHQSDIVPLSRSPEKVGGMFDWSKELTLLAGCAPCQPFSPLNHGGDSTEHEKWAMLDYFRRIVDEVRPDLVATENVFGVRNHEVYQNFVEALEEWGYHVNSDENKRVYCPEYGIPQNRKRWVVIASREGPIELPEPTHPEESDYPSVKHCIDDLPPIEAGEVHSELDLHRSRGLSDKNLERIDLMEPGADWRIWEEKGREDLLLECHKKESGRSFKAPYGRMHPDDPAPTITTQFYNYGSGRFGHYDEEQDRALSLLEGAMLQTFPKHYEFYEDWEDTGVQNLGRMIGNAVPPRLGELIGEAILEHVGVETEAVVAGD
jgi:DNA (cytosine-5)-methyltransferase 1